MRKAYEYTFDPGYRVKGQVMIRRYGKRLLSLITASVLIITETAMMTGCAPLYRFIKGKDPDWSGNTAEYSAEDPGYTKFFTQDENGIIKDTLGILVTGKNARLPGTAGEKKALDFAATFLEANGYSATRNYFDISYDLKDKLNLVDTVDHQAMESVLLDNSGKDALPGEYEIINAYGGTQDDLDGLYMEGKLLLVEKKYRNLTEIATEASENKAAGILYYINEADTLPMDTLNTTSDIPIFSINYHDAQKIRDYIKNESPYTIMVSDQPEVYESTSSVLIAKPKDFDDKKDTYLITADIDSSYSPGANRNASAVTAVLHMAQKYNAMTDKKVNYVFAINGSGSIVRKEQLYYYMDQGLKGSIKKVIELSDLGSGNNLKVISSKIDDNKNMISKASDMAKKINLTFENSALTENDVFTDNGYDTVRIERTGDDLAGTDRDTKDRIDMGSLIDVMNLIMNTIKEE